MTVVTDVPHHCPCARPLQEIQDRDGSGQFPAPGAAPSCGVTALSPQRDTGTHLPLGTGKGTRPDSSKEDTQLNQVTLECYRGQGNTGNVSQQNSQPRQ